MVSPAPLSESTPEESEAWRLVAGKVAGMFDKVDLQPVSAYCMKVLLAVLVKDGVGTFRSTQALQAFLPHELHWFVLTSGKMLGAVGTIARHEREQIGRWPRSLGISHLLLPLVCGPCMLQFGDRFQILPPVVVGRDDVRIAVAFEA